jgi:hypothetical protein
MSQQFEMAPPERWQHGATFAIGNDGVQRVQRPVDVLRRHGRISDADLASAERYYIDYALGWEHVGGEATSVSPGHPTDAFVNARTAVGGHSADALSVGVLNDAGPANAPLALALKRLTDHYARVDAGPVARRAK